MRYLFSVIIVLIFPASSFNALALDCVRPIQHVWSGYDGNKIYVIYADGYQAAGMQLAYVGNDEHIVNRTLSVILSGHIAGKSVTFRYEGGADGSAPSCTPTVVQKLIGAWVS
jgi:hypothetical protein